MGFTPFQYHKPQESTEEAMRYLSTSPGLYKLSASDLQRQLDLQSKYGPKRFEQQLDFTKRFQPQMVEAEAAGIAARQKSDAALLEQLAPVLRRADDKANPQRTAMMKELYSQKMGELQAGGSLTPQELRTTQQDARAAQQSRGLTQGAGPVREEALFTTRERERRRSNRQRAATAFLSTMNTQRLNPTNRIMGQQRQVPNILGAPDVQQSMTGGRMLPGLGEALFDVNQKQAMENHMQAMRKEAAGSGGGWGQYAAIAGNIVGGMFGYPMLGSAIGGAVGGAASGGGWEGALQGGISGATSAGMGQAGMGMDWGSVGQSMGSGISNMFGRSAINMGGFGTQIPRSSIPTGPYGYPTGTQRGFANSPFGQYRP